MATSQDKRRAFYGNLIEALQEKTRGTFAAFRTLRLSQGLTLRSLHVEGAGELLLPLSARHASRLRSVCEQVPFGKRSVNLVDTSVPRCWQLDSSKVTFPESPNFLSQMVQALAVDAVRALGLNLDQTRVEAHLYNLLFYEVDGHFTFHRDTEKEEGMFATMILQLPTEEGYTGGELIVKHSHQEKTLDSCSLLSRLDTSLGFCYTIFLADCMHELRKITSGTRLCLAFNLVRRNSSSTEFRSGSMRRKLPKVEAALAPWLKEVTEDFDGFFCKRLAFPLQHKYTQRNLSFAGLKGNDKIMAELLKECRNQKKEKWLDLYLCLVTKYELGSASSYHPLILEERKREEIEIDNWVGVDDNPSSEIPDIDLDIEIVRLGDGPFDEEPDCEECDHHGNYGPTVELSYHTAMIVADPKPQTATPPASPPERLRLEGGNSNSWVSATSTDTADTAASRIGHGISKQLWVDAPGGTEDRRKRTRSNSRDFINLSTVAFGRSNGAVEELGAGFTRKRLNQHHRAF